MTTAAVSAVAAGLGPAKCCLLHTAYSVGAEVQLSNIVALFETLIYVACSLTNLRDYSILAQMFLFVYMQLASGSFGRNHHF